MMTPNNEPSAVDPMPTASDIRAPWMILDQTSRPNESVPIQCCNPGWVERMRGIDRQGVVAADQIGKQRGQHERHHDDEAEGAENVTPREECQATPATVWRWRRRVAARYRS